MSQTRLSQNVARMVAAAIVLSAGLLPVAVSAAPPDPLAPDGPCYRALRLEKSAANDSASHQASYDAAVTGLATNARCGDPQMHLVNEAYLLSLRAAAAHELKVGDWRRDLTRANDLLLQCSNWPGLRGKPAGANCTTQRQYNMLMAKTLEPRTAAPAASAMPAPAATNRALGPATTPVPAPALPPPPAPLPTPAPPPRG